MEYLDQLCPICDARHPKREGITVFTRQFECICGTTWEDVWCSNCEDECPACHAIMTPLDDASETVLVEAQP
jgi:hypothetical protein